MDDDTETHPTDAVLNRAVCRSVQLRIIELKAFYDSNGDRLHNLDDLVRIETA